MSTPNYPGVRLTEKAEMLRRVAPLAKGKGAVNSTPGSEAFKPDPAAAAFKPGGRGSRDNGGLSTKRAAEDPQVAYWAYLKSADPPGGRLALGTWGFKVGEADELKLPSFDDGGTDCDHPENHATVWFPMPPSTEVSNTQLRLRHDRLAEELLKCALTNGCLYRPSDPWADAQSLKTTPL
ncbi:hypothetical protein [Mycobacterium marinum]|uniref:hypothetical protein n=1 Tax=Mycobacterium marinum TaxID=1781 RepID=UPI00115DC087|nr:hypothetical protein [Mycobacterium marinum]